MSDDSRLDRIEALVEKIGQRVDSNARAIEALSVNTAEYQRDRVQLYQLEYFRWNLAQSVQKLLE